MVSLQTRKQASFSLAVHKIGTPYQYHKKNDDRVVSCNREMDALPGIPLNAFRLKAR